MGSWNLHTRRGLWNDAGTLQEGLSKWNNAYPHLAIWKAVWEDTRQRTLLLLCLCNSSQIVLAFRKTLHRQQGNSFPPLLLRSPAHQCGCTWSAKWNNRNRCWNFRANLETRTSYWDAFFVVGLYRQWTLKPWRSIKAQQVQHVDVPFHHPYFIMPMSCLTCPKEKEAQTPKNIFPLIQMQTKKDILGVSLCVLRPFNRPDERALISRPHYLWNQCVDVSVSACWY